MIDREKERESDREREREMTCKCISHFCVYKYKHTSAAQFLHESAVELCGNI